MSSSNDMKPHRDMKVFNSVHQLDFDAWEELRDKQNLLTDANYFKAIEEAQTLDCKHRYFEFYQDDKLICTMYGFTLYNDAAVLSGGVPEKIIHSIRNLLPNFLRIKTLEVGSPIAIGTTISSIPEISFDQFQEIASFLIDYAKRERIQMILLRDFEGGRSAFEDVLIKVGFETLMNFPVAKMKLVWDSFDDYLAAMQKRYRSEARRKMRAKSKHNIRTVFYNDENALEKVPDYVHLYKKMMERSKEFPREFIGENYHTAMFKHFGEDSYWLQYLDGETLVAFCHFLIYKDTFYGHYMGLDYEISFKAMLYFNFYYDSIAYAIMNKIKSIEAGVTTYEAKTTAGLSVYPLRMYLWHKNPLFLRIFSRAYQALTDFQMDKSHYVFSNNEHQYIWDGETTFVKPGEEL